MRKVFTAGERGNDKKFGFSVRVEVSKPEPQREEEVLPLLPQSLLSPSIPSLPAAGGRGDPGGGGDGEAGGCRGPCPGARGGRGAELEPTGADRDIGS